MNETTRSSGASAALAFGTLGIVFGDIGTSPLYAMRESFEHADLEVNVLTAYGITSVVFWALIIVISAKYLFLVMRADYHGEGGILALTALMMDENKTRLTGSLIALGVVGTALVYGDGLITPAISVLSAVEGFEVASPAFNRFVVPLAVLILVGLFSVQRRGTAGIAAVFSPVMVVWFGVIGALGVSKIVEHPSVLRAVSPTYAIDLFASYPLKAFLALGSVFLVVTGGEALYADMGHFGRKPIELAWYCVVLPGLLLNYFGQAALLSDGRDEVGSPLYDMAPSWGVVPLAVLATLATVIASQALISGAFSLTVQAMQLDFVPRLAIRHTSSEHAGQVYVPLVNWLLMIGSVGLVLAFRSSSALASAYGIAVTTTMLITSIIFYRVVRHRWGWSTAKATAVMTPFVIVDSAFLGANIPKIPSGGWFPLLIGALLALQMTTWRTGRSIVAARMRRGARSTKELIDEAVANDVIRVPGCAVYLTKNPGDAPPALIANIKHYGAIHEQLLIVSVDTAAKPQVSFSKRGHWTRVAPGVAAVTLQFGYREVPDVPAALNGMSLPGGIDIDRVTYFLGDEVIESGQPGGMYPWREHLFALLDRGAANAARFFHLPADQVVEVGTHVKI